MTLVDELLATQSLYLKTKTDKNEEVGQCMREYYADRRYVSLDLQRAIKVYFEIDASMHVSRRSCSRNKALLMSPLTTFFSESMSIPSGCRSTPLNRE